MNWYKEIARLLEYSTIESIAYEGKIYHDLAEIKEEIDFEFDNTGHPKVEVSVTVWTDNNVHFPLLYKGKWILASVPRGASKMVESV